MENEATCAACATPLAGRWCHACGQDTHARPRPMREMANEVFGQYSPIDTKWARTAAALALRPARILEAYRRGASSLYVTPLKLFIGAIALFLIVLSAFDLSLYQFVWKTTAIQAPAQAYVARMDRNGEIEVSNSIWEDRWLEQRLTPAIDSPVIEALERARLAAKTPEERTLYEEEIAANGAIERMSVRLTAWLPNMLWLLLPIHAWLLGLCFGRRLFLEHAVVALWAHATAFILLIGLAALNAAGAGLIAGLVIVPYIAYLTIAAAHYYALSWVQALWRSLRHPLLYLLLVMLPACTVIYLTVMDWSDVV